MFILGTVLFGRAIFGPEVDTTIRPLTTLGVVAAGIAVSVIPALAVGGSAYRAQVAFGIIGVAWMLVARRRRDPVPPRLPRHRGGLDHPGGRRPRPRRARAHRGRPREQRTRRRPLVRARGDGHGRGRCDRWPRPRRGAPPHPRAPRAHRVRARGREPPAGRGVLRRPPARDALDRRRDRGRRRDAPRRRGTDDRVDAPRRADRRDPAPPDAGERVARRDRRRGLRRRAHDRAHHRAGPGQRPGRRRSSATAGGPPSAARPRSPRSCTACSPTPPSTRPDRRSG